MSAGRRVSSLDGHRLALAGAPEQGTRDALRRARRHSPVRATHLHPAPRAELDLRCCALLDELRAATVAAEMLRDGDHRAIELAEDLEEYRTSIVASIDEAIAEARRSA